MRAQRWFCFDVGETLIDESRVWSCWAEELDLPVLTLFAVMGAVIADGRPHEVAFEVLARTGWRAASASVEARYGGFAAADLYPDALPVLARLRASGFGVAVIANQPASRHDELLRLGLRPDVMAMSDAIGVHKPDAAFFDRVLELLGRPRPSDVAYVGDRIDNDVGPAAAAGMRAVWLRRGPWGHLQVDTQAAATLVIASLDELASRPDAAWDDAHPAPAR